MSPQFAPVISGINRPYTHTCQHNILTYSRIPSPTTPKRKKLSRECTPQRNRSRRCFRATLGHHFLTFGKLTITVVVQVQDHHGLSCCWQTFHLSSSGVVDTTFHIRARNDQQCVSYVQLSRRTGWSSLKAIPPMR